MILFATSDERLLACILRSPWSAAQASQHSTRHLPHTPPTETPPLASQGAQARPRWSLHQGCAAPRERGLALTPRPPLRPLARPSAASQARAAGGCFSALALSLPCRGHPCPPEGLLAGVASRGGVSGAIPYQGRLRPPGRFRRTLIVQPTRSAFPDYSLFVLDAGAAAASGEDGGAEVW